MVQGGPPWSERKAQAFWRGSMYCHSGFPHRIQGAAPLLSQLLINWRPPGFLRSLSSCTLQPHNAIQAGAASASIGPPQQDQPELSHRIGAIGRIVLKRLPVHNCAGRDVPCSRGIMRNVSFDHIGFVDAWSRTTQYGDDRPVHPDALPESFVDVGRWRDYK